MISLMKGHRWLLLLGVGSLLLLAAACQINPQKREAELVTSADKYLATGDLQNAIIEYRNALKIEPRSVELEFKLGQAYFRNRQYQQADAAYRKANQLNPDYAPAQ